MKDLRIATGLPHKTKKELDLSRSDGVRSQALDQLKQLLKGSQVQSLVARYDRDYVRQKSTLATHRLAASNGKKTFRFM